MKEIQAPNSFKGEKNTIFLGGSIEMNTASRWQDTIVKRFEDRDVTFLNPRRDNWNSSIEQSIDNNEFSQQVHWELDAMSASNIIVLYFDPDTKSPITLLEFGLIAASNKTMLLCCPKGYWRRGNIEIVAKRYRIKVIDSFIELIRSLDRVIPK